MTISSRSRKFHSGRRLHQQSAPNGCKTDPTQVVGSDCIFDTVGLPAYVSGVERADVLVEQLFQRSRDRSARPKSPPSTPKSAVRSNA